MTLNHEQEKELRRAIITLNQFTIPKDDERYIHALKVVRKYPKNVCENNGYWVYLRGR